MVESATAQKPVPVPDVASLPFWEAARQRRLVVQHCDDCGGDQYPPDLICRWCQSERLSFVETSGRGVIYTFAVYTRSFMAGFEAPYVLALVDLDDGWTITTNIVGCDPGEVTIGMQVAVAFQRQDDTISLPYFAPRT